MGQSLVWLTYQNLDELDIKTLQDASAFGDLCKSFTINNIRVDGTPTRVQVEFGNSLDMETGLPLTNKVRVGVLSVE